MRLLNLDSLRRCGAQIPVDVPELLDIPSAASELDTCPWCLKGHRLDANFHDICKVLDISSETMCVELIRYSRQSLAMERRLPDDHATIQQLPVELMTHLEIAILALPENDTYDIHQAHDTRARRIR